MVVEHMQSMAPKTSAWICGEAHQLGGFKSDPKGEGHFQRAGQKRGGAERLEFAQVKLGTEEE
jgi:hypothetical protein